MITVLAPGARTLVQDHGRGTHAHLGVPASGAADRLSHDLANRLVGNPADAATLEVALYGPTLTFSADAVIAYVGADTDLFLDAVRVPVGHTLPVAAGQTLTVGTLREGVCGYLAVAGGLTPPPVLGSRASCTLSGLGPAPLSAGATVPVGSLTGAPAFQATGHRPAPARTLRFLPGPHSDLFPADALTRFASTTWSVSPHSSRVGTRLTGAPLTAPAASLPSLGMARGAIQVPPSGSPIVLGPDHGATGGYPVLGVLLPADQAALAQTPPGRTVRFAPVDLARAEDVERAAASAATRSILRLEQISA